jgi:hypothetical protein
VNRAVAEAPKLPRPLKAGRFSSFNPFCLNSSANPERFRNANPKPTDFRCMPTEALNINSFRIAPCFLFDYQCIPLVVIAQVARTLELQ